MASRPFWGIIPGGRGLTLPLAKPALALRRMGVPDGLVRLALSPAVASRAAGKSFRDWCLAREGEVLGRLGSLEVRLARDARELRQAQRLRFRVFYEEMSALANPMTALLRRDADRFDRFCDHLLVVDRDARSPFGMGGGKVVGTYRLLRQRVAEQAFGFYTQGEFDISPMIAAHRDKHFLELGRSCVLADYRDKRTLELLWRGIYAYIRRHGVDVMMGCASLEGTDPAALAQQLSFLHHYAPCPEGWRVRAKDGRYVPMGMLPKSGLDVKAALRSLPPLIKGYLRLGATFGEGAVVDHQFGTTDVFVLLRTSVISERYLHYLGSPEEKKAA
ncbi:MAG: GNAT family N-acetyltransferase [Hyphomicrobiales bacterium]